MVEIVGVIPEKTQKYENMLAVFEACKKAGVEYPKEVVDFFELNEYTSEYVPPQDGMETEITNTEIISKEGNEETIDGAVYTIDISKIPEKFKKLKIKVAYW